ncbi:MAG TPA: TIGR02391 family protein [Candidatus Baltobacteraceae bacterium]
MSHDLIVEHMMPGGNPRGPLIPTRLGIEVAAAAPAANAAVYALRVIDLIPVSVRARVLPNLVSGEFDMAIAAAFKAVEVRMRERAGLSTSLYGSRLAKAFFARVEATSLQRSERKGQLADEEHLFEGLMGLYRDRAVHEIPHVDSMEYALEIIISAAHLLRIVDAAELKPQ